MATEIGPTVATASCKAFSSLLVTSVYVAQVDPMFAALYLHFSSCEEELAV